MDPRIILRKLIERLEPELGKVSASEAASWADDSASEAAAMERARSGRLLLVQALMDARKALASGDPDLIAQAALICPTFERKGRIKQIGSRAKLQRSKGGQRAGAQQAAAAEAIWAPYVALYRKHRDSGQTERQARNAVKSKMGKDHFVLPGTDDYPSEKTIRQRLRG